MQRRFFDNISLVEQGVARRRHAGLRTPSRQRGAGSDGGEEFPRVERAGTPTSYPRSLPRENYPRFVAE